jgi:hypothetical protein
MIDFIFNKFAKKEMKEKKILVGNDEICNRELLSDDCYLEHK